MTPEEKAVAEIVARMDRESKEALLALLRGLVATQDEQKEREGGK